MRTLTRPAREPLGYFASLESFKMFMFDKFIDNYGTTCCTKVHTPLRDIALLGGMGTPRGPASRGLMKSGAR